MLHLSTDFIFDCRQSQPYSEEGIPNALGGYSEVVTVARQPGYQVQTKYVRTIPACDYKTMATRPAYSVLSKRKIRATLNYHIPHWRESLWEMLTQLRKTT
ncbi:MAG: sugar nucleotide-binding protein [Gammaproteobacteria bacterium]|nr:sugar nucleotide-binding protein [Gammaproteobacteria bacterium]